MSYNTKVNLRDGGDELRVEAAGEIHVVAGGQITNDGVQASAIADPTDLAECITAITAIIDALEGVGILATS